MIGKTKCVVGIVHTYYVPWRKKGLQLLLRKKRKEPGVVVHNKIENYGGGDGEKHELAGIGFLLHVVR